MCFLPSSMRLFSQHTRSCVESHFQPTLVMLLLLCFYYSCAPMLNVLPLLFFLSTFLVVVSQLHCTPPTTTMMIKHINVQWVINGMRTSSCSKIYILSTWFNEGFYCVSMCLSAYLGTTMYVCMYAWLVWICVSAKTCMFCRLVFTLAKGCFKWTLA